MERRKSRRISTLSEANPVKKNLQTLEQVSSTEGVSAQLGLICDAMKQTIETVKIAKQKDQVWSSLQVTLEEHLSTFEDHAKQQPVSATSSTSASLEAYSKKLQAVAYGLIHQDDNPWSGHASFGERIGSFAKRVVGRDKLTKKVAEYSTGLTETFEEYKRSLSSSATEQAPPAGGQPHRSRDDIINAIERWARSADITSNIFCLADKPGTGKSAIAKEMARRWKEQGVLAGYFSFTPENSTADNFCTHIANDIASNIVDLKPKIEAALKDDGQPLKQRWQKAVVEPLQDLGNDTFFVVDALDACSATDIKELLQLIISAGPEISGEFSVRFLITTQPADEIVSVLRNNYSVTVTSFTVGSA
ncbi:hypothetical protein FRB91_008874 [Serendipita sp. 411]|nr:hypothetical protein FRC18_012411 [Serendipita sp. 400]KAG8850651.1 hypothetical protein FRB91_008874 [Serendipita sp. 411]